VLCKKKSGKVYYWYSCCADDFSVTGSVLYFNTSAAVGDTSCVNFVTVKDTTVEGSEVFTFQAVPRNNLDAFTENMISLNVADDDGMKTTLHWNVS
jgi:hypothetical protein